MIRTRLQSIFTAVARHSTSPPNNIQVIWTTDISGERVGSRDIVIYFVNWYASGGSGARGNSSVVERYLRERQAATSGSLSSSYDSLRRQHFDNNATPSEGGVCIPDTDNTPPATHGTSCCEVYADIMNNANPINTGATNRSDFVDNQGFAMAGMAYHESMHNKIDPFKGGSWNLHNLAGGGLARPRFSGSQTYTDADIREMANYIYRVRRQYILRSAASQPATPPSSQPAQPATPSTVPTLPTDPLDDLDI